jgi:hypothetical protein
MRVRQRRLVLVVALLVGGTAAAQQPHPADTLVVIHGKVRDAATREPISGAVASTIDSRSISTNASGEFSLPTHAGRVTVMVRRIGYDSTSADVESPSPSDTRYVFEMHRAVQTLDTMTVATRASSWSPKLEGFEHRLARRSGGTFFTRTDIELRRPISVSDIVRRAAGVRVVDSMGVKLFASARGSKVVDGRRGRQTVPCIMRVGVDGQVMEWGFAADHVATDDIYGIEIYAGPATTPREYASQIADGFCGLVMIWTR